jgi:microsomal epoxide hydrolase
MTLAKLFTVSSPSLASNTAPILSITVNFCIMPEPKNPLGDMSEAERKGLQRTSNFKTYNSSYALQHATKPSTIGAVLSASPLALLAWVGEK